jgi:hypothetical protein
MVGIPPARDSDVEDVVWALQTAEALWKRNERGDAVVWLRRAAQAAGEANDDDRALMLARGAAELTEWMSLGASSADVERETVPPPPAAIPTPVLHDAGPPPIPPPLPVTPAEVPMDLTATGDRLSIDLPVNVEEPTPVPAPSMPSAGVVAVTVSSAPPSRVLTAAEQHAGMLDPWSEPESKRPPRPPPRARVPATEFDDEVVTSAKRAAPDAKHAPPPPPKPSSPSLDASSPLSRRDEQPAAVPVPIPPPYAAPSSSPLPEPIRGSEEAGSRRPQPPRPSPARPPPPRLRREPSAPAIASPPKIKVTEHVVAVPAKSEPLLAEPPTASAAIDEVPADPPLSQRSVDLSGVEAFADLPDDARVTFAGAGNVLRVGRGVEVTEFALVVVLDGAMNIVARGLNATAATLEKGAVLRARGTLEETIPLGLVCSSQSAVLATWDDEAVSAAFRTCPWVEEDLRAAADAAQARAGSTLGELGSRLNDEIRAFVMARLKVRALAAGEACALAGEPVGGIFVLGAGALDLVNGDTVEAKLKPGDFLFPTQTLSAARAPATARAAEKGALLLEGDRQTAQELFATQALLLEMFAGM